MLGSNRNSCDTLLLLAGMNIPFDITAGKGPVIADPIRTMAVRPPVAWCTALLRNACASLPPGCARLSPQPVLKVCQPIHPRTYLTALPCRLWTR